MAKIRTRPAPRDYHHDYAIAYIHQTPRETWLVHEVVTGLRYRIARATEILHNEYADDGTVAVVLPPGFNIMPGDRWLLDA